MSDRGWLAASFIPAAAMVVAPCYAADYLSVAQAQRALFPEARSFDKHPVRLSDEQKREIRQLAGVRQRWDEQSVWRAAGSNGMLGWFIVDDVVGKHEFITYAAAISPEGEVLGLEILTYRETHGGEVRDADWRANLVGKTLDDPLKLGKDVPNISGATLSCRNVTDGVRRLLALRQVVLDDG